MILANKHVLVTGGTGSLGKTVVRRILSGEIGIPRRITVFSRDEAKQHQMRVDYRNQAYATDDIMFRKAQEILTFQIGNMRDYDSVCRAVAGVDIVINAAALKQVPTCENFPYEAVKTNIEGAENLVRAIRETKAPVEQVVGISTDKACKPINVMGMTKAIMERIFVEANLQCGKTRFNLVRYGNVIASRGSVVPLFLDQIENGGPVTITVKEMTRFLLSLDKAVDTVFEALHVGRMGETFVPRVEAARMVDLAQTLIDGRDVQIIYTGIRPGEKLHEIMVSEEERWRTVERGDYYVIQPMLDELYPIQPDRPVLQGEYSSENVTLDYHGLRTLLEPIVGPRHWMKIAA
ncbi:MAG TPA: polysaccharide biosynthesis protein [Fimbriimonadaceae bacterium]|nr:polysaccharide biosynthesis protein [Fimbriimonadaceae bacterium]